MYIIDAGIEAAAASPTTLFTVALPANKSHAFFRLSSRVLWPTARPYFLSKQRLQLGRYEHMTSPVCLTFGGPRQTLL